MSQSTAELPITSTRLATLEKVLDIAAIVAGLILLARLLLLIDRVAVDVLFWDQYGYYTAIWNKQTWWQLFRYQHGPHRMGLGFPIIAAIDEMTGWNQRVQAFVVGITMALAGVAALLLKRRLTGSLKWYDIAIPLLFLSNRQWALYADVINLSHGALPLLLIVLTAFAWLLANPYARYAAVGVLAFLATFTGFGFFVAPAVAAVCVIRLMVLWRAGWGDRRHELAATMLGLGSCALTLAIFFRGYVFEPAVPGFQFPHPRPLEYLYFMGLELAYLLGAKAPRIGNQPGTGEVIYGMMLLSFFAAAGFYILWRSLRKTSADEGRYHVLLFLFVFTAAFLLNSAVGRVCTGLANAMTSRYVPLLMPGLLAVYLVIVLAPRHVLRSVAIGGMLVILTVSTNRSLGRLAAYYVDGKRAWVAAYRETHSIHLADVRSRFQIFPDTAKFPIKKRLDWMEERKLSLFRE